MKKRILIIFSILVINSLSIFPFEGNYVRFEQILPEFKGIKQTGISSILQDSKGYMWFEI